MSDKRRRVDGEGESKAAEKVKVVLGSMEFGRPERESETQEAAAEMTSLFVDYGHEEVDTAYMYQSGRTETILGALQPELKGKIVVSTKANPWADPWKSLTPESIKAQFAVSLERLQATSVDILYLHAPDHVNPIEDSLRAVNELYTQGTFKRFGLSNYASWQVAEIVGLCKANGWVMPTVYQGMYNAFTRDVSKELLPCLHHFGISFYAYNPLAGGLLTGRYKYADLESEPSGRFFGNTWADTYRKRFWKKPLFDALDLVQNALQESYPDTCPTLAEASIRWMMHHSELSGARGDGMIIGASSMTHMKANLDAAAAGPLTQQVVDAFEQGWTLAAPHCAPYFR